MCSKKNNLKKVKIMYAVFEIFYYFCRRIKNNKNMKKILGILGVMVYGVISNWLIWLFFWWITPYVMSASWLMMILYILIDVCFISFVVSFIAGMLSVPTVILTKDNTAAKVVYTLISLFWGYSSCALPFHLNMEFGTRQWILAIFLVLTALGTFATLIAVTYKED